MPGLRNARHGVASWLGCPIDRHRPGQIYSSHSLTQLCGKRKTGDRPHLSSFILFIDDQVAIEGLGFDQVENKPSTHDQVIDLGDLPVIDQTQVVQNDVILTVMEIGVDVAMQ